MYANFYEQLKLFNYLSLTKCQLLLTANEN